MQQFDSEIEFRENEAYHCGIKDGRRLARVKTKKLKKDIGDDIRTDLPIIQDLLNNPFLSQWQKNSLEAMVKDKRILLRRYGIKIKEITL